MEINATLKHFGLQFVITMQRKNALTTKDSISGAGQREGLDLRKKDTVNASSATAEQQPTA